MNIISIILYTISINSDNIPIGISFKLKNKKSKFNEIFKISILTSLITFISMIIGTNISSILPIKFANRLGASVLIAFGIYLLIKEYKSKEITNNTQASEIYEIVLLSINNIFAGISASITGINYFFASIFNFIFSTIFLYLGTIIGKKINSTKLELYSNYLSAIILIILGIIELK